MPIYNIHLETSFDNEALKRINREGRGGVYLANKLVYIYSLIILVL